MLWDVKKFMKIKIFCREVNKVVKKEKVDSWRNVLIIVKIKILLVIENNLREIIR